MRDIRILILKDQTIALRYSISLSRSLERIFRFCWSI